MPGIYSRSGSECLGPREGSSGLPMYEDLRYVHVFDGNFVRRGQQRPLLAVEHIPTRFTDGFLPKEAHRVDTQPRSKRESQGPPLLIEVSTSIEGMKDADRHLRPRSALW